MLIPETHDPYKKLGQVVFLMNSGRPIPAEKLILESISIFEKNEDKTGLAWAYDNYAQFLRSSLVTARGQQYAKTGFYNHDISMENRLDKSIEYFEMAKRIYEQADKPDMISHIYYNMGITYLLMNKDALGCQAYDQSITAFKENMRRNPDAKPAIPKGYNNFEEYILDCKKRAGCR